MESSTTNLFAIIIFSILLLILAPFGPLDFEFDGLGLL